jgi:hypothetical protein
MKTLIKTTVVTLALSLTTLYASGGHSHEGGHGHSHSQAKISKTVIIKQAHQKLSSLIQNGKIDKSWLNTPIKAMEQKPFHHGMEWVVSYENKNMGHQG